MADRYRIDATWKLHESGAACVHMAFERIEPLEPAQREHLIGSGMLKEDDEPVSRVDIGESIIFEVADMTQKRVRAHALTWLGEYGEMTVEDSYELYVATQGDLELLSRIEAAVAR